MIDLDISNDAGSAGQTFGTNFEHNLTVSINPKSKVRKSFYANSNPEPAAVGDRIGFDHHSGDLQ
jgi:hypothetical protein